MNPLSTTIFAILIRMGCIYVLNRNKNTFDWNNSKLRNILLCVFLKTVIGKYWEHSFTEHETRISKYLHLFKCDVRFNNNINTFYWKKSKLHNILINIYYYQFVTCLTILKITAFLMIFWNVFIHSHAEWSVKCRKVRCLDRGNFWNRTIITFIQ